MSTPDLSVIIPTFKRHDSLSRTLKSVELYRSSSTEVIVVDQSPDSRDRSDDFCKRYPFCNYICLPKPGLPHARNIGNALFEDVEFSCRIRENGFSIHYAPHAIVYHYPEKNGGCHESTAQQYLIERLHNHTLFYLLHIKKIPSKSFRRYQRNLIEYISRKKNKRHSLKLIVLCVFSIGKAFPNAGVSLFLNPKLD